MKKKNADNDSKKATNSSSGPINRHTKPLFKQNGRTGHDRGSKEHIINRCNDRGVKYVKGLIKVANLNTDADHKEYEQSPK